VRDTDAWDPARFDGRAARALLGVGDAKVVMFLGTPRGHKGVDDLVEAMAGVAGARLVIVGAEPDHPRARRWAARPDVIVRAPVAFDEVPRYLAAADVVAVPQRATSDTVGQVPAKLFDAMAMARPIVSTSVSMIPEILEGCGLLAPPGEPRALRAAVESLLTDPDRAQALGRRARARCIERYSFASARAVLLPLIDRVGGAARATATAQR
jgi:glycosyltransferase involved in cell wall biosynthesis